MGRETQATGPPRFGTLALLALAFAIGYAFGSRTAGPPEWHDASREPTEIAIDGEHADENDRGEG